MLCSTSSFIQKPCVALDQISKKAHSRSTRASGNKELIAQYVDAIERTHDGFVPCATGKVSRPTLLDRNRSLTTGSINDAVQKGGKSRVSSEKEYRMDPPTRPCSAPAKLAHNIRSYSDRHGQCIGDNDISLDQVSIADKRLQSCSIVDQSKGESHSTSTNFRTWLSDCNDFLRYWISYGGGDRNDLQRVHKAEQT